jgi:hypothetical protein
LIAGKSKAGGIGIDFHRSPQRLLGSRSHAVAREAPQ